ncbi:hypothetical protein CC78DRAFT_528854 [Lojkania enalia]|uniref:Secreted protein n=1 Tax=Lojkania enalia TaxID=147567 RepID=A0A9P4TQS7_9PLEO|nr:hypothetical protein CC78DRAFT_528854 [Didymosphaeria enalia]
MYCLFIHLHLLLITFCFLHALPSSILTTSIKFPITRKAQIGALSRTGFVLDSQISFQRTSSSSNI